MAPMPHWASRAHSQKICPSGFPWAIIFLKLDCSILENLEEDLHIQLQNQNQPLHQPHQCQNMLQPLHQQPPQCQIPMMPQLLLRIMILTVPLFLKIAPQPILPLHPNPFITPNQPKRPMCPCPLKYRYNQPTNLMCPHPVMEPPHYWDNILNPQRQ